jgi:hypothetical protein
MTMLWIILLLVIVAFAVVGGLLLSTGKPPAKPKVEAPARKPPPPPPPSTVKAPAKKEPEAPVERLGVNHRKQIFIEVCEASRRSIREAESAVGPMSSQFVELQHAYEEQFVREVSKKHNIPAQKLRDIEMEGRKNKWPNS